MANIKITDLTAYAAPRTTDVMPIVDVTTDTTKKVAVGEVVGKITGDVDVATDGTSSIAAGAIVNADVNANAEIAVSKLADGTARQLLQTDAAGTGVEWTSNVDVPGTLDVTGATTLDSTLQVGGNTTIEGDLTVEGTTTTIETTTLLVEDKNIEMGVVGTPTDITADGGGITLKGATDKTINWLDATDSWTSSENVDLASGKSYRINNTEVLNSTTLGSGVTGSSLTSVGTISSGTWQGTAIDDAYLDTISTAGKVSNSATTATSANTASAIVARDASGNFSAGTITADLTGNADTATALSSSRAFAVTGDVTGTVSSDLTSGASIATSIAAGVIVDGDVNASAAIAGTKIAPDFGSQTIETTGVINVGGIQFNGDTAAVNALDDYEEGTWTPVLGDSDGTSTHTHDLQIGYYRKIGDTVIAWARVSLSALGSNGGGIAVIRGFPFPASTESSQVATGTVMTNAGFVDNYVPTSGYMRQGESQFSLNRYSDSFYRTGTIGAGRFTSTSDILLQVTYLT